MSFYMLDGEQDGPVAPLYSVVWFGAIRVDDQLDTTFEGKMCPISDQWIPEALAVSGLTREETLLFPKPEVVIPEFVNWVLATNKPGTRPQLISDNNGFDYGNLNYYFWKYAGRNPFGHTSRNLNDLYKGMQRDMRQTFDHLVVTPHDHNPVNDARGNAEALLKMKAMGLKISL